MTELWAKLSTLSTLSFGHGRVVWLALVVPLVVALLHLYDRRQRRLLIGWLGERAIIRVLYVLLQMPIGVCVWCGVLFGLCDGVGVVFGMVVDGICEDVLLDVFVFVDLVGDFELWLFGRV